MIAFGDGKVFAEYFDTCARIASKFHISVDTLLALNHAQDQDPDEWLHRMYKHSMPIAVGISQDDKDQAIMDLVTSLDLSDKEQ